MWLTSTGKRTLQGPEATLVAAGIAALLDVLAERLSDDDESVDDDDDCQPTADMQIGIAVYDGLTIPQRIAMLHHAARHLLTLTANAPEDPSAIEDATIAAIFLEIQDQVTIEIDLNRIDNTVADLPSAAPFHAPRVHGQSSAESIAWYRQQRQSAYWRTLVMAAHTHVFDPAQQGIDRIEEPAIDSTVATLGDVDSPMTLAADHWENMIDELASAILWDRDFELADGFLDEDPSSARHRRRLLGIHDDYFMLPPLDPGVNQTRVLLAQARSIANRRPR